MCKTSIYEAIFSAVCAETEISREQIESHTKQADVVEARSLLFHYLHRAGFYPAQIARMTGHSRQSVNVQLQSFCNRCQYGGNIIKIYKQRLDRLLAEYLLPPPLA